MFISHLLRLSKPLAGISVRTSCIAITVTALLFFTNAFVHAGDTTFSQLYERNVQIVGQFGAPIMAVHVDGNIAYVGEGYRMSILDVADPEQTTVLGATPWFNGTIRTIEVSGDYAYIAAGKDVLHIVDVSDATNPIEVSRFAAGGQVLAATVVQQRAYLATENGLTIIDVANPALPIELGHLLPDRYMLDVAVAGDYAYIAASDLIIVDVSNPSQPIEIGVYSAIGANSVDVDGDIVVMNWIEDWSTHYLDVGVTIIDVSDPHVPAEISSINTGWWYRRSDVELVGNRALITAGFTFVLDIEDPQNPAMIDVGTYGSPTDGALNGNFVYTAGAYDGLQMYNVSNVENIVRLGVYGERKTLSNVKVLGDRAFTSSSGALRIIDVADPAVPIELGAYDVVGDGIYDIAVSDNNVLLGNGWDGLQLIDVTDATNPIELGSLSTITEVNHVALLGELAVVHSGESGLHTIDISDPANPVEIGSYDTSGYVADMVLSGAYAFVGGIDYAGILVIDLTNPAEPEQIQRLEMESVSGLAVEGNRLYVTGGYEGLQIFDIADPAEPQPLHSEFTGHSYGEIALSGNLAYVADNMIRVFDVTDPEHPAVVGVFAYPDYLYGLAANEDLVYMVDSSLSIYRYLDLKYTFVPMVSVE